MFTFGENWASFSRRLDESRIEDAMRSLSSLFGEGVLKARSFLDIGCGSGLFSIAAARLGARPIVGMDMDPVSVATSQNNAARWLQDSSEVSFLQASILDTVETSALGTFDVVYSWGVLHHTGNMALALQNTVKRVRPNGLLMIAIYNKHWSSSGWRLIKWSYNRAGSVGQRLLVWVFTPVIFLAKWSVTRRNPLHMQRGMDFMHNIIDWLGGYPYEYASPTEMRATLEDFGLEVLQWRAANVPTGCNEFVCRRK
jgi:SAM-dependent methyltransferase